MYSIKSILAILPIFFLLIISGCKNTGGLYWKAHAIGERFPNAIYIDVHDLDGDGIPDIVANNNMYMGLSIVNERTLKKAMSLAYLMAEDGSIRETIHLATDIPTSLGVKAFDDYGKPVIVLGTGSEDGSNNPIYSFAADENGNWVRQKILDVPGYYAPVIVPCDFDLDGDKDLALMGENTASAPGSWLENTGNSDPKWIAHFKQYAEDTTPIPVTSTAYDCEDLNEDGYPDLVYGLLYKDPETGRKWGEIIAAINPGQAIKESGDAGQWKVVMVSDDNYLSADMHMADIDQDGHQDIIANNIFKGTVTWYRQPDDAVSGQWQAHDIGVNFSTPGDMWIADMNGDGRKDVVVVDVLRNSGFWLENPGTGADRTGVWEKRLIFSGIGWPGDFVIVDFDGDGDLDFVGTSMTLGKVIVAEQVAAPGLKAVQHLIY